jgi:hypothetical protein
MNEMVSDMERLLSLNEGKLNDGFSGIQHGAARGKLRGHCRHAGAEKFSGAQIGVRRRDVGTFVGVRLRRGTEKEAVTVQRVFRRFRMIVSGREAKIDPVHPVLRGKDRDLLKRRQLVAGARCRVGETGGNLFGPLASLAKTLRDVASMIFLNSADALPM